MSFRLTVELTQNGHLIDKSARSFTSEYIEFERNVIKEAKCFRRYIILPRTGLHRQMSCKNGRMDQRMGGQMDELVGGKI